MDEETRKRLEAVEARLVALENRPVATLEVTEVKPITKRKPLTEEQKQEHVRRLRAGKIAAQARRLAAPVGGEKPAIPSAKDREEAKKVAKVQARQASAEARLETEPTEADLEAIEAEEAPPKETKKASVEFIDTSKKAVKKVAK